MNSDNDKTTYLQAREGKPTEHINKLMEVLAPLATFKSYKQYRTIQLTDKSVQLCLLLTEGSASICRHKDGMILTNMYAPAILGIATFNMREDEFFIRTETNVMLGSLPVELAVDSIRQNDLLLELINLQAYYIRVLGEREFNLPGISIYESICLHLLQLMHEPEGIRQNTSAYTYIQERTNFSRSRIMNILSALKQGGYIKIENGKLQHVGKLPERF
ncbi:helix-turn-helix domain-containing protein [Budviciaceae bacterium BWR-B9]|uniref:Helix-turn-helix domain-containing protein n=1 Tax=Limnobaculum allomyrinae TaxID=2791986 RepID=A0ABS1IUN6_9GAMM|nr:MULTISPECIES: winged helix-turn-helix transcriptional regulator [Limnobaculum]MBK5145246.1 helix-turn-helix domain-containing protein [Limnobaculum allomyrinae]MBV7693078.1 helix-turn-helix domain-containing protein [Limnobaculum sp. M2-1]